MDAVTDNRLKFLTNNFALPALTIALIYKVSLASRIVLQVDQATPANQEILWHQRERSEDPDLDCHLDLRAGDHRPQASRVGGQPLPDSTDSQYHAF